MSNRELTDYIEGVLQANNEVITKEAFDENGLAAKVIEFLNNKKVISDDSFHNFAERLNVSPHKAEEAAYGLLAKYVNGGGGIMSGAGASEGRYQQAHTKKRINPRQLAMGKRVEKEHTKSPKIAERIAKDHLQELPDYYTRLEKMEQKNFNKKASSPAWILLDKINHINTVKQADGEYGYEGETGGVGGGRFAAAKERAKQVVQEQFPALAGGAAGAGGLGIAIGSHLKLRRQAKRMKEMEEVAKNAVESAKPWNSIKRAGKFLFKKLV